MKFAQPLSVTALSLVVSAALVLPAAALTTYVGGGTGVQVTTGTQGTVDTNTDTQTNVSTGVSVGATGSASGSTSGSSTASDTSGTAATDSIVTPMLYTRTAIQSQNIQPTSADPSTVRSGADLSGYVAAQLQGDANLSAVNAGSTMVSVTYKEPAKLFGFIPASVDATAMVDASGNVTVSYPWYSFVMSTGKADLQNQIKASVTADVLANGSASGGASASFSASQEARIIADMHTVMQAAMTASSNTNVNGNANVNVNTNATGAVNTQ